MAFIYIFIHSPNREKNYVALATTPPHTAALQPLMFGSGASVQAGAGIVADSVPELEYEETVHKASGLARAIDLAEQAFGYQ